MKQLKKDKHVQVSDTMRFKDQPFTLIRDSRETVDKNNKTREKRQNPKTKG